MNFDEELGLTTFVDRVEPSKVQVFQKTCKKCGQFLKQDRFRKTKSEFFPDGKSDICDECWESYFGDYDDLKKGDKFCQYLDIGFDVNDWINDVELSDGHYAFKSYCDKYWSKFNGSDLDWSKVHDLWAAKLKSNDLEDSLDFTNEVKIKELRKKWGSDFTNEELFRLEALYDDIEKTQSIVTAIQRDNAKKMSMLSLKTEQAIINDGDGDANKVKSYISAYNDLAKTADFTPKTAKNLGDFESFGEVARWIEQRGYATDYYKFKDRDEIDFIIKDIQQYVRRIVVGESNIKDELNDKLDQLQRLAELERSGNFDDIDYRETVQLDDSIADEFNEEFDTGGDE